MKHILKYLFVFIVTFMFMGQVEASNNTISLKLSCPAEANPRSTINCDLYANITGSNIEYLKNISVEPEDSVSKIVSYEINEGIIEADSNTKIGTITAKSGSTGTGRIIVNLDARFSDGEPLWRYNISTAKSIKIASSNNYLSSIKIDGLTIDGFNKEQINYYVTTNKESISLSASKESSSSIVTGTGTKTLKCGNNTTSINVKAQNGDNKKYTVVIKRECSNNAYLKGITISQGKLSPEFKEDVYNYNVKLDKEVTMISVNGVKDDATQKITGEVTNKKIDYGKTKISLVVTSETGETKTYNITFEKEDTRDDNNLLSSLSLSSGNITFDPNTFEYETKVLYNVETIKILAVPEKETSKVKITGGDKLKVGENTIIIKVTSEKGTAKDYKIKVIRLNEGETLGDNPNIKELSVIGYKLPFAYERDNYKLVIEKEEALDIIVVMDDPSATYEIKGNEDLKDGSVIEIITKSADGSSRTYTIEITKPNSAIYFIIGGVILTLIIAIPIIVYFKSVKKKKELVDVNGYKIGKEYEEKDYSRKVIGSSQARVETNQNTVQTIEQPVNQTVTLERPVNQVGVSENDQNNQMQNDEDLDAELLEYVPNESSNKCPGCGRELLGSPIECPYCKVRLR